MIDLRLPSEKEINKILHDHCLNYRKHCYEVCNLNTCKEDIHSHTTQWFCRPCYAWLIGDKDYMIEEAQSL